MQVHRDSSFTRFNLIPKWWRVVNLTPLPLYPGKRPPVTLYNRLGGRGKDNTSFPHLGLNPEPSILQLVAIAAIESRLRHHGDKPIKKTQFSMAQHPLMGQGLLIIEA
jgi:hypothetical protein